MQLITIIQITLSYINVLLRKFTRKYMMYCVEYYLLSDKLSELYYNIYDVLLLRNVSMYYVENYTA